LPLVEKLLAEIVNKYKSGQTKDSAYLARLEKKQMVKEIRLLSKALIKSEQTLHKAKEKNKLMSKQLKSDRLEADFKLQNSLRRQ
jgi:transcription initiation factor IIF auxiliary subunit